VVNRKQQRRAAREQKIANLRADVARRLRQLRIAELEQVSGVLARAASDDEFTAFAASEGKELLALRRADATPPVPPSPLAPAAPRNSVLQEAILAALADGERAWTRDIMKRLGLEPTPARHATVSRALARLRVKGLVEAWKYDEPMQGNAAHWQLKAP
jgi:hypothetical protein